MAALSSSFLQNSTTSRKTTFHHTRKHFILKISSVRVEEKHGNKLGEPRRIPETMTPSNSKAKRQSFLTNLFNLLDQFICDYLDPPLRSCVDPRIVLSGNFAPVGELPPTPCTVVEGNIPASLRGTYIRNGPNPQFVPRGPYHLFDGDGMLHAITINGGGSSSKPAVFCSRFVRTYKYNLEREIGYPVVISVFSAFNGILPSLARCSVALGRYLAGEFDPHRGIGSANTSLMLHAGKLFALGESDLPYAVELTHDGDIVTLGRHDSFGGSPFVSMTAHPKIDGDSGEAFAFRHGTRRPFLAYFRIGCDGIKQPEVAISSLEESSFIHDFAVSGNYAVFPDTQIVIRTTEILKGRPPVRFDASKSPRLGIIPRYAMDETEMWWVEVPGLNMIHAVNAWEEDGGDTVVMVAPNVLGVENVLERIDLTRPSLELIEISVKERSVRRRKLSDQNLDFAVMNPAYVGKKNRYIYAGIGSPMPKISGVVKMDMSLSRPDSNGDCTVASRLYPPGCYGGEPYFVPRDTENVIAEEDDGYLLTYLHDENNEESKFLVMDAKSPTLEIVAVVKLPQRVPYGFHGIFVPEKEIKRQ